MMFVQRDSRPPRLRVQLWQRRPSEGHKVVSGGKSGSTQVLTLDTN
jgi:hypothetical protein